MEERIAESAAPISDAAERPLRHGVARAALASGAAETATRVLMVALSIATARALLPGQIGVLGLAVIVVGIVSLIAAAARRLGLSADTRAQMLSTHLPRPLFAARLSLSGWQVSIYAFL